MNGRPFIRVRQSPDRRSWAWVCTKCPAHPRNGLPCGGKHLVHRFSRPYKLDARLRATNAALTHYVLKHSAREG